jgi:hypothetical protein
MRIADVEIGCLYRADRGPGARVRALEKIAGGRLRVEVEAGSIWTGDSWVDAGIEAVMQARDLTSTWSDHART